jgi:hypothetical protein
VIVFNQVERQEIMSRIDFLENEGLKKREVRLFPTINIKNSEIEMRATSALLATVTAVSEFADKIVKEAGGVTSNVNHIKCYTEVSYEPEFSDSKVPACRPDGLIRIKKGKTDWAALLEVKVGKAILEEDQIITYQNLAKNLGIEALITVSNQTLTPNGDNPYIGIRRLQKVKTKHFSWERLQNIAEILIKNDKVKDEDQRWILREWIKYITHDSAGIIQQPDLGEKNWKQILNAVKNNNLQNYQTLLVDVIHQWNAFMKIVGLKLGAGIGREVKIKRDKDEKKWMEGLKKEALDGSTLSGKLNIPSASDINIDYDIRAKRVYISSEIKPLENATQRGHLTWFLKQLRKMEDVPNDLNIKVEWKKRGGLITCASYEELKDGIEPLLQIEGGNRIDKNLIPRFIIIEWSRKVSSSVSKKVLQSIIDDVLVFYGSILQNLKPSPKKPNKLTTTENKEEVVLEIEEPELVE